MGTLHMTKTETAEEDIVKRLRQEIAGYTDDAIEKAEKDMQEAANEIERLRGALRTINSLIPRTKEITAFPHWVAIAGDIAECALKGTWPAYGVMPKSAKETKNVRDRNC